MSEAVAVAVLPARIGAAATTAFGALAMFLSALGVYGLVAFAVSSVHARSAFARHWVHG